MAGAGTIRQCPNFFPVLARSLPPHSAPRSATAAQAKYRGIFCEPFPKQSCGRTPPRPGTSWPSRRQRAGRGRWPASRRPGRAASTDLLVIGLGYVGLPLAREAAFSGFRVVGYDLNTEVVAGLNAGRSHVGDVPPADIAEMLARGFRATSAEEEAGDPDTVVICVPTPLSADSAPDLSAVRGAAQMTGRLLRPGMLVVLEFDHLSRHHR